MLRTIVAAVCLLAAGLTFAHAEEMKWQADLFNDKKSLYIATLTFGVPETDNQAFEATCNTGADPNYIPTTIGYNTGKLKPGATARLRFIATGRAGRKTSLVKGRVFRPESGEGVYGVRIRAKTNDDFWELLSKYRTVSYRMKGRSVAKISLKGSSKAIRKFLRDCRGIIGES